MLHSEPGQQLEGGGGVVRTPWTIESKRRQNMRKVNIAKKKIDFLGLTYFKLLNQIKANSIYVCDFSKVRNFC
jgi:hypothetical protein